jgi:uncharacterized membrane protein YkoI
MKKKVLLIVSSISIAALLGFGIYKSNAAQAEPKLTMTDIEALVAEQYPGTITDIELEKGFNRVVYEVEVQGEGKEYEIKFDGNTGEVLKLEEREIQVAAEGSSDVSISEKNNTNKNEVDDNSANENASSDDSQDKAENNNKADDNTTDDDAAKEEETNNTEKADDNKQDSTDTKTTAIDPERAKEIALAEFSGTITEFKLDEDDGRLVYDVEIEGTTGETELEIDAYTGEIVSISLDSEIDLSNDDDD